MAREVELLLEEDGVGAEIDVLPAPHQFRHRRSMSGTKASPPDAHDGRPALLDGVETRFDARCFLKFGGYWIFPQPAQPGCSGEAPA